MTCAVLYYAHRYSPAPLGMPLSVEVLSFGAARTILISHKAVGQAAAPEAALRAQECGAGGGHSEARMKYG